MMVGEAGRRGQLGPEHRELLDVINEQRKLLETQQYIEDCQVCCRPIVIRVRPPLPAGSARV